MSKLKKNLIKVGTILAATVMVGGWFVSPLNASGPRDCDDNAVIKCGTLTKAELTHVFNYGASGPHQSAQTLRSLFYRYGLEKSDIPELKNGVVTKSGLVYVSGHVVARDVYSMGRHDMPGSRRVSGVSYPLYIRHPSVSFVSDSIDAFVLMNSDGSMAVAVLKSCGNIIPGVGKRAPRHRIIIRKFNDINGNKIKNSNEPWMRNITFRITGPGTNRVLKTDGYGMIKIENLVNGTYTITETVPSGWRSTTGAQKVITISNNHRTVNFGNQRIPQPQEGQLEVTKFNDRNANKVQDEEGEELLAGWTFNVTGPNGFSKTITTGEDGTASLDHLKPGKYVVTEVLQSGWENTTGLTANADVADNKTATLVFGNRQPETPPTPPTPGGEVEELPVSGPAESAGIMFGSMTLAGTALSWLRSKKSLLAAFRK